MPKTLTFLCSLILLTSLFILTDWKNHKKEAGPEENFTVSFEPGNAFEETSAQNEYFIVSLKTKSGKPINLSGWSVSLNGDQRLKLPEATKEFKQGDINELEEIVIAEESQLFITTGASPVGVSFGENRCIGLLSKYQNFTPALPPAPLGYESYNLCLTERKNEKNFLSNRWRIYLGFQNEMWNGPGEIITLLDENGQELIRLEPPPRPISELVKKIFVNLKSF